MTVPGIDVTVAASIVAAVGDFSRFDTPDKLVCYLGLNPSVRQSGNGPPCTGGSPKPVECRWRSTRLQPASGRPCRGRSGVMRFPYRFSLGLNASATRAMPSPEIADMGVMRQQHRTTRAPAVA